jgi:peroxiredoxin
MALSIGTPAPDFALNTKTADGLKEIKLSDQFGKNKVVLLFFPFAFTSVCQNELCSVSSGLSDYENLGATVYGISIDSPFAQEAFAQANNITVPLLSDFNTEVSGAYDVLYDELLG